MNILIERLHVFNGLNNVTLFTLGALKRARPVSQSVKMFKMSTTKKYYAEYGPVIHPVKVATRKSGRNPTATPT